MMVAGQMAGRGNFRQNLANDAAQGVLGEDVVADMVLWHAFFVFAFLLPGCRSGDPVDLSIDHSENGGGGFCCQVPPDPA